MKMKLDDFDYDLPESLIAQYPSVHRDQCRLLDLTDRMHSPVDRQFFALPGLLQGGDLLIFNDTRVVPARLLGHKSTGGQIELLLERVLEKNRILAHLRASKSPKVGQILYFPEAMQARVCGREENFYVLEIAFDGNGGDILAYFRRCGQMPLPPYIQRSEVATDRDNYQTVYASKEGAVAAPTAGLHFTETLLARLKAIGVQLGYLTLHVGAGTFQPIRTQSVMEHKMHAEFFSVSQQLCEQIEAARQQGRRIIAVGTTTVRALETAAQVGKLQTFAGESRLFIYPGFRFRVVDALLTNFHLPRSTLLIMLSAFAGREFILGSYQEAIHRQYRFFSYGDAMFVARSRSASYNAER